MTEESLKRCSKCKEAKSRSEYCKDSRTGDKLQRYCRECKTLAQQECRKKKPSLSKIKKETKMMALTEKVLSGEAKTLTEAYYQLGTTKDVKTACTAAAQFIATFDEKSLEAFRQQLVTPERAAKISRYLDHALDLGTFTEQRDAIVLLSKMCGLFAPDKVETTNKALSMEEREKEMAAIIKKIEEGEKQ